MITQAMAIWAGTSCLAAILICAVLSWLISRYAGLFGLIDHPDGKRKLHGREVPLGGGLAIFLTLCLVLGANVLLANPWGFHVQKDWNDLVVLFLAATWLVLVGLADDRFHLRGRHKLLGQIIAAAILVGGGYSIDRIGIFGLDLNLQPLQGLAAGLWFLATINSINLLDGLDGLAGTLGVIFATTVGIMACLTGHFAVAFIAFVLASATLGFLFLNLPPARLFLGDSGSMLIGLMLGVLALRASLKGPSTLLLTAVLALWTLPFLDSFSAIVRRKLTGRSIYAADRSHLHHRLMDRFKSNETVLMVVALLAVVTAASALIGVLMGSDLLATVCTFGVVGGLIATGLFGRLECRLALCTVQRLFWSIARRFGLRPTKSLSTGMQLHGHEDWKHLWDQHVELADQYHIISARIDLQDPFSGEQFFATYDGCRCQAMEDIPVSHHEIPLWVGNRPVGRIQATVRRVTETFQRDVDFILNLAEPFEERLTRITEPHPASTSTTTRQIPQPAVSQPIVVPQAGTALPSHVAGSGKKGNGNGNGRKSKSLVLSPAKVESEKIKNVG